MRNLQLIVIEGIRAKIQRAHSGLQSLAFDIDKFCTLQSQQIEHQIFEEAGKQTWTYRGNPQIPIEFSVRVGEIVYNLRSALDHLVWQLVLLNEAEPGGHNEFPIFCNKAKYAQAIKRDLKGVSPGAQSHIKAYQPFQMHGGIGSQLWMLYNISTIDKHRHLNMTALYTSGARMAFMEELVSDSKAPVRGQSITGKLEANKELSVINDPSVLF